MHCAKLKPRAIFIGCEDLPGRLGSVDKRIKLAIGCLVKIAHNILLAQHDFNFMGIEIDAHELLLTLKLRDCQKAAAIRRKHRVEDLHFS